MWKVTDRRLFAKNIVTMMITVVSIEALLLLFPFKLSIPASVFIAIFVAYLVTVDRGKGSVENPFQKLKELGAHLALVILPSERRIILLPTKKDLTENKIVLRTLHQGRLVPREITLSPSTEFQFEVPEMTIAEEGPDKLPDKLPVDAVIDGEVSIELEEPHKQVWKLDPFEVDASLIVFPDNVITKEQLQAWFAERDKNDATIEVEEEVEEAGVKKKTIKEIRVPVFRPKPYAIDVDSARTFSAVHRGSKLTTALDSTQKLLNSSDSINVSVGGKGGGGLLGKIANIIAENPLRLVLTIVAIVGLIGVFMILPKILAPLSKAAVGTGMQRAVGEVTRRAIEKNMAVFPPP